MYYIRVAGQTYGPYPFQQLQGFVREGRITPQSEVSSDGQIWVAASTIPGLFGAQPTAPVSPGFPQQGQQVNPYATPQSYDRQMSVDPSIDPNRPFFTCYTDVWHKATQSNG
ncbi:MAG: DUF4339 domain-containing protein, partial [Planctomycetia bacterium]|nr:DUF4339 domain-containing protein [Planctomycetia bacterium]